MKVIKGLIKIIGAGLVAIALICVLLCFYDIVPVHVENPKRNTDYVWPAHSIWVKATEGISFGRYDANGFNNLSVVENPDIIVLGSSHMEATEVMQNETAPYLLSEKLEGKYSVYNMGISGHNFYKVCQYLPANLELYDKTPKVVIIETSTVSISQKNVDEILSGTVEYTPSHNAGIIGALQRVPFFRSLYHQAESGLLNLFLNGSGNSTSDLDVVEDTEDSNNTELDEYAYDELFSYLKRLEDLYGTQMIICYHPTEQLLEDGSIYFERGENLSAFSTYAQQYNISFIDMSAHFENMYYVENHVAHGFCTGKLATGHLNKYGHAAMADELYEEIVRLEEVGELCQ